MKRKIYIIMMMFPNILQKQIRNTATETHLTPVSSTPIPTHWQIQGGTWDMRPPLGLNSFILCGFRQKNLQNNRLAHLLWELPPPRKILDPPMILKR